MTQEISYGGYGLEPITMKKKNERRNMRAIQLGVAVAALLGAVAVIHPGLGQIGSGNPSLKADSIIPVAASHDSLASALPVQAIDGADLKIPSGGTTSSSAITISNYYGDGYTAYTRYIEDKYLRKVAVWQLEPARSRALSILVAAVANHLVQVV